MIRLDQLTNQPLSPATPTDPEAKDITWHNDGRARCATYRFNTKRKDHLFCPKCGASLGIDNRETLTPPRYGISVSSSSFLFSSPFPLLPRYLSLSFSLSLILRLRISYLPRPNIHRPSPTPIHTKLVLLSHCAKYSPTGPRNLRRRRRQARLQKGERQAVAAAGGGPRGTVLGRGEAGDEMR